MINGSPTDNNARLFKKGAHSVFDGSSVRIGKEYDTPDWSPDKAQQQMEQAISALGKDGFVGVYAANDGTAGGAIAAMKGAGIDPSERPTTGQDAELAALQRILRGEQFMTIYKAIKPEAEATARVAVALARDLEIPDDLVNTEVDNGAERVPTLLYEPTVVTDNNMRETVVKDGFFTAEEICTPELENECRRAGLE
jgi:D-xylose transport system substrate-binding protein